MIELDLSNEEKTTLDSLLSDAWLNTRDCLHLDLDNLTALCHEVYVISKLRDQIKIDEGDTATNEYAPSSY